MSLMESVMKPNNMVFYRDYVVERPSSEMSLHECSKAGDLYKDINNMIFVINLERTVIPLSIDSFTQKN